MRCRSAVIAVHTQAAFFQPPTLAVGLELLLHVLRKRSASLGTQLTKCRVVPLDELIKQRGFWSVPSVAGRVEKRRHSQSPHAGGDGRGGRPGDERGPGGLCRDRVKRTGQTWRVRSEMQYIATDGSGLRISRFSHCE